MSRYYSVLVITVVIINGLHCTHLEEREAEHQGPHHRKDAAIRPHLRNVITVQCQDTQA